MPSDAAGEPEEGLEEQPCPGTGWNVTAANATAAELNLPTHRFLEPACTCSRADIKPAQTLHRLLLALFSVPHTQPQNSDNPPLPHPPAVTQAGEQAHICF